LSGSTPESIKKDFGEHFIKAQDLVKKIDTIVANGAYYRANTIKAAEEKKLLFFVSAIMGDNIPENRIRVNEFQINEQTHRIETCPSGNVPPLC
jgi:hypothetical protein